MSDKSRPPPPSRPRGSKHPRRPRSGFGHAEMGPADEGQRLVDALDTARALVMSWGGRGDHDQRTLLARHLGDDARGPKQGYSPASARDTYVFRQRAIPTIVRLFGPKLSRGPLTFVTLILEDWYYPMGELNRADAKAITRRFKQRLRSIVLARRLPNDGLLVGMLEIGLRLDSGGHYAGYQLHIHAVADATMMRVLRHLSIRRHGVGPSRVRRPIDRREIPHLERLQSRIGYCLKVQPRRMDLDGVSQTTGESGPTTQHELDINSVEEALLWLDQCRFSDLLVVLGSNCLRSIGHMKPRL